MTVKSMFFLVIGFLALILISTNPSISDHRQIIVDELEEKLLNESGSHNHSKKIGQKIGEGLGPVIIERAISRDNYLFFSITKLKYNAETKNIGFGILGNVWVLDYNFLRAEKKLKEKSGITAVQSVVNKKDSYGSKIVSKKLKIIKLSELDKYSKFIEKRVGSNEKLFYYLQKNAEEDMHILYFYTNDTSKIYRLYICNFGYSFRDSFYFTISDWVYDKNGNCKAIFYKVSFDLDEGIPKFNAKRESETICAG